MKNSEAAATHRSTTSSPLGGQYQNRHCAEKLPPPTGNSLLLYITPTLHDFRRDKNQNVDNGSFWYSDGIWYWPLYGDEVRPSVVCLSGLSSVRSPSSVPFVTNAAFSIEKKRPESTIGGEIVHMLEI